MRYLRQSVSALFVMGHIDFCVNGGRISRIWLRTTTNIANRPREGKAPQGELCQGDSSVLSCMCWANTASQAGSQAALVVKFIYMLCLDDISRTHTHSKLNTLSVFVCGVCISREPIDKDGVAHKTRLHYEIFRKALKGRQRGRERGERLTLCV